MFIRPLNKRERGRASFLRCFLAARPLLLCLMVIAMVAWLPAHWPTPLVAMAIGDVLVDDDGNVIVDEDGNLKLDDGTGSCSCSCTECDQCTDSPPGAFIVDIAGQTNCCNPCSNVPDGLGHTDSYLEEPASIDGTYTATYSEPCIWRGVVPIRLRGWFHIANCVGTATDDTSGNLDLSVSKQLIGADKKFVMSVNTYFSGLSAAPVGTCDDGGGYSISNSLTVCGSCAALFVTRGTGGTATLTPA